MRLSLIAVLTLLAGAANATEAKTPGMDQSVFHAQSALAQGMICMSDPGGRPGLACLRETSRVILFGAGTLLGAGMTYVAREGEMADYLLCAAVDYLLPDWQGGWQWTKAATRRAIAKGEPSETQVGQFTVYVSRKVEAPGHAYSVYVRRLP